MIFVPILKSKANAEPRVIEAFSHRFSNTFIPYLQIIKNDDKTSSRVNKILRQIGTKSAFVELDCEIPNNDYINKIMSNPFDKNNIIPVIPLKKIDMYDNFIFLNTIHNSAKSTAIKIDIDDIILHAAKVNKLASKLLKNDYIFVNIHDSAYLPLKSILATLKSTSSAKIIVIYQERIDKTMGKEYYDYAYDTAHFKNDLIECIKNAKFDEDGFASYCTAKNVKNDPINVGNHAVGVLITYNGLNNKFYTVKSNGSGHISTIYTNLKNRINDKTFDKNKELWSLYEKTPTSYHMLEEEMAKKGCKVTSFIKIGISHYIEQILQYILKE